jgi:hypothetical protein
MITLFTNSYVTLEEANTYLVGQSSSWVAATTEQKERALIQATSLLEDQNWLSQVVESTQPLAWPRLSFSFFDPTKGMQVNVPQGSVPQRLKTAIFNQALHLIQYPSLFESRTTQDFESISIGPLSVQDSDSNEKRSIPVVPYGSVTKLLRPLVYNQTGYNVWWRAN